MSPAASDRGPVDSVVAKPADVTNLPQPRPRHLEQADLVSYGIFGLIDAIDKFDPGRGYKFETYAISRIKGAMLDELR